MLYAYDVETYPDLFTAVFHSLEGDKKEFVITPDKSDSYELINFLTTTPNLTLVGHNSIGFDDIVSRAIITYPHIRPRHLANLAQAIIKRDYDRIPGINDLRYPKTSSWRTIDTMALTRVNQIRISLKHAGVVLRLPKLQDLPYAPNEYVVNHLNEILPYNHNDVFITLELFKILEPLIEARREVGKLWDIDIETANDTEIAKTLLDKFCPDKLGIPMSKLKNLRTERDEIFAKECIGKGISFKTKSLQKLLTTIQSKVLRADYDFKYKLTTKVNKTSYKIGVGGLHSVDRPTIYTTNERYTIVDFDFSSYYPMILLNNDFFPSHLGIAFLEVYRWLVETRLKNKKLGKKDKTAALIAQFLKIAINSVFGLMGNKYYWLYDPKSLISITITGQLILLMLIEILEEMGIEVVSANTDGIVSKVPNDMLDVYYETCTNFATSMGYEGEFTIYKKYIGRDVNNYITITESGKVKTKGAFENSFKGWDGKFYNMALYGQWLDGIQPSASDLKKYGTLPALHKGFKFPIITYALYQYFVHDVTPETTIGKHDSIYDFCMTQRADTEKFDISFTFVDDEGGVDATLQQKTNRFFVSRNSGGLLRKDDKTQDRRLSMLTEPVTIVNNIDQEQKDSYDLDEQYYIDETWRTIRKIEPKKEFFSGW